MRVSAVVTLVSLALAMLPLIAHADVGNIGATYTINSTGPTQWLPLSGQNNCTVTVTGNPVGLVAVPQVATDLAYQWVTTASMIGGGSISTTGAFNGSVATLQPSAIRVNVTGYSSGATQLSIVCGPGGGTGGGGGGTVNQGTGSAASPWFITVTPPKYASCTGTAGANITCAYNGATICTSSTVSFCAIKASQCTFYGIWNQANAAQTVGVAVYDNASTNSGPLFFNSNSTNPLQAAQDLNYNPPFGILGAPTGGCVVSIFGSGSVTTGVSVVYQ